MSDLIKREDAEKVLCDACGNAACPKGLIPRCSYYEQMQAIPAMDAMEVVRCRECKNSHIHDDVRYRFCDRWRSRWNTSEPMLVDDEDYCAWGQRREDGDA